MHPSSYQREVDISDSHWQLNRKERATYKTKSRIKGARKEIFCQGTLDMMENGEFILGYFCLEDSKLTRVER